MTPLEKITQRVNRNGNVDDELTQRPLLTLEEFFDGNTVDGSMCCNCTPTPSPSEIFDTLKAIRARRDVADVYVQITMFDDPAWPFSDTVWIITTADSEEVKSWFEEFMAPDECWEGWPADGNLEPVTVPAGFNPVACWWD